MAALHSGYMWPPEATGDDWTHPKQCLWFPQSCNGVTQNSQKYQVYFLRWVKQGRADKAGCCHNESRDWINESPPRTFYLLGPFMCTHEKPEAAGATRHQHRAGNRYESDEVRLRIKTGENVRCKAACRCATPVQAVAGIAQPVRDLPHRFCHTLK